MQMGLLISLISLHPGVSRSALICSEHSCNMHANLKIILALSNASFSEFSIDFSNHSRTAKKRNIR